MFHKLFGLVFTLALAASTMLAVTPPTLVVSDGTNSVTIDSTGAVTPNGTASVGSVPTHTTTTIVATNILVGNVNILTVACTTNLNSLPLPTDFDCLVGGASASNNSTVTITFTGSAFNVNGTVTSGTVNAGGNFNGGGTSLTLTGKVNGNTVAQVGPLTTDPFQGSATGPANAASPIILTEVLTLVLPAGTSGGGDYEFFVAVTPPTGGGCPATPGYWKNARKHPFPNALGFPNQIGNVLYSKDDFYTILGGLQSQLGATGILGFQLVAAIINVSAGATHSATVDNAITSANALLAANNINLLTDAVQSNTPLGQSMITIANVLAGYNNANFSTCTEGSGLTLGTN